MTDYITFGPDRVYILMAIARKSENPKLTHNTEIVWREVAYDGRSYDQKLAKLRMLCQAYSAHTFRLYLTVNARDVLSTYWNFRERMNQWARRRLEGHEPANEKMARVGSHWMSELQRPENAADSYFVLDLDEDAPDELRDELDGVEILDEVETPNGWHFVTAPFNFTELETDLDLEVKTDDMVFMKRL